MRSIFTIISIVFLNFQGFSQDFNLKIAKNEQDSLVFSDTLWLKTITGEHTKNFLLVTENPYLWPNTPRQNCYKEFYFKVGSDSLEIAQPYTGDPHYIDKYPRGILQTGIIYSYSVRFHFQDRYGPYHKVMGFKFTNGEFGYFTFKGNVK
ncbi:MAG: hypothetical protein RLZZ155_911 [Bacteroidota bacterium]